MTSKLSRYADGSAGDGTYNNIIGNLVTLQQIKNEFRQSYEVENNCMIWYDYAVIKLSSDFESLANIGLVCKFDGVL